jgi:hypothetical protein
LTLILIPLLAFLAPRYGALGGATAWLVAETLYVMLGSWLTHRHFLRGLGKRWIWQDVGIPLAISAIIGLLEYFAIRQGDYSVYVRLLWGAGLAMLPLSILLWFSPHTRAIIGRHVRPEAPRT